MKKLFTFLIAMTTITTLFAQSNYNDNRGRDTKKGSATVYQDRSKGSNDRSYQQGQQDWNKNDQSWNKNQQDWNKNDRGRDDHKTFDDHRMQDNRNYNKGYEMNNRNGRYEAPQRKSNAGGIVAGVIIGGILGALLSH